jgi:hypothetical protein
MFRLLLASTCFSFLLCVSQVLCYPATNYGWPPCANLTFSTEVPGVLDVGQMLYDCVDNIPSSQIPPSYYNVYNGYYPTNVSVQFAINNLINVDDLNSQITLDYYFRCTWNDPRLYLPEMWSYINPEAQIDGLVITPYILNSNDPLNIWMPDFYFPDSAEQELVVQTVKLRPNGTIYWSRHLVITLSQPAMSFINFPLDTQNFSIRFQSYAYDSKLLSIVFPSPAVVFLTDPQNNNKANIAMNVLWDYETTTSYSQNTAQGITYNPNRRFWVGYVNLRFTRASDGVIYRLGLPVTICLVVVGFSFWSTVEKRIEVTLQMLLVTAALYLVIGQIIPFVGYLTTMDLFVTTVFICLAVTIGINFYSLLLEMKEESRPMNLFYRTLLVTVLRVVWIPVALVLYIAFFQIYTTVMYTILIFMTTGMAIYGTTQIHKLQEAFEFSIRNLRKKAEYIHKVMKKRKISESSTYGEKFIKELKLDMLERLFLYLCRNYYLTPAKSELSKKYLSRFSMILKDERDSGVNEETFVSNPEYPQDSGNDDDRLKYLNEGTTVRPFSTSSSKSPYGNNQTFVNRNELSSSIPSMNENSTENPMVRVSDARIDSDDENEDDASDIEMKQFRKR